MRLKSRTRKPWYRSRVLWVNAVGVVLITLEAQLSLLQPALPGNVYAWLAMGLAVVNALMRLRHIEAAQQPRGDGP